MKDYLKQFASVANYDTWKSSENYIEPNVSLINSEIVEYNPFINYANMYLTFEAIEDTTFTFTRNALQYSLDDGATWTTLAADTATPTITAGNKILWKQTNLTIADYYGIGTFSSTGQFNVSGNIMSLYYGDNFVDKTDLTSKDYAFCYLFKNCSKLVNAKNLILPATTLSDWCYNGMFQSCTSLISIPELPATTLVDGCYIGMFSSCYSLTTTPKLPATTLAQSCYLKMFSSCKLLTTAPELPATTLAQTCYQEMFYNCTSLTTAPKLPATTLAQECYENMFYNCTSLTTVLELPATTLADHCYSYMFRYCKLLTSVPKILPATTLANSCYVGMFNGCTSLTTAPELPATTLVDRCYYNMFNDCVHLNYIKCLATDISATDCTTNWVDYVRTNGTFIKNASMSSWTTGDDGIPSGWTIQDAA